MCPNPQFSADFVSFNEEEILNGKLHFLWSVICSINCHDHRGIERRNMFKLITEECSTMSESTLDNALLVPTHKTLTKILKFLLTVQFCYDDEIVYFAFTVLREYLQRLAGDYSLFGDQQNRNFICPLHRVVAIVQGFLATVMLNSRICQRVAFYTSFS